MTVLVIILAVCLSGFIGFFLGILCLFNTSQEEIRAIQNELNDCKLKYAFLKERVK